MIAYFLKSIFMLKTNKGLLVYILCVTAFLAGTNTWASKKRRSPLKNKQNFKRHTYQANNKDSSNNACPRCLNLYKINCKLSEEKKIEEEKYQILWNYFIKYKEEVEFLEKAANQFIQRIQSKLNTLNTAQNLINDQPPTHKGQRNLRYPHNHIYPNNNAPLRPNQYQQGHQQSQYAQPRQYQQGHQQNQYVQPSQYQQGHQQNQYVQPRQYQQGYQQNQYIQPSQYQQGHQQNQYVQPRQYHYPQSQVFFNQQTQETSVKPTNVIPSQNQYFGTTIKTRGNIGTPLEELKGTAAIGDNIMIVSSSSNSNTKAKLPTNMPRKLFKYLSPERANNNNNNVSFQDKSSLGEMLVSPIKDMPKKKLFTSVDNNNNKHISNSAPMALIEAVKNNEKKDHDDDLIDID